MRRSFYLFNIILLLFPTLKALSQNDKSTKFEISANGGLSLPVGLYGENNPSKSAIYVDVTQVKGFAKEKSGFAKSGYYYNLELKYNLNSTFKILLITGTYSNPVETTGMTDLLTQISAQKVEEDSYRYFYINPGFGYQYSISKFNFGLNLFAGYSFTSYPYYKFIFLNSPVNPPDIFAHYGPRPNLGAVTLGTSFSTTYNISNEFRIGLDVLYQRADFDYTVTPKLIPGGGGANLTFSDILKVRVINAGVKVGYCF